MKGIKIFIGLNNTSDEVAVDILSEDGSRAIFSSAYLFDYPDGQHNFERFKLDLRCVLDGL